jgi:hypothetical protein
MKAVLRKSLIGSLGLASIVLAAPHQSVIHHFSVMPGKTAICRLADAGSACCKAQVAARSVSAFMHESATTLSW